MASTFWLTAPAKVNLSLHIEGRRADGYHELNGLVGFADFGDLIEISSPHDKDSPLGWELTLCGPFAQALAKDDQDNSDNLVIKAANLFDQKQKSKSSGRMNLHKNLPIAAGLGGGSSDAATVLNLLQQKSSLPLCKGDLQTIARKLGADVPMCLTPSAQWVEGVGEIVHPAPFEQPLPAVLVNPLVAVSTAQVFGELAAPLLSKDFQRQHSAPPCRLSRQSLIKYLLSQRNDLQTVAIRIAPIIAQVLAVLNQNEDCALARMSGSGATCFGLYETVEAAQKAATGIKALHPHWWVQMTQLN